MKFIDNVTFEIESGSGGDGMVAWRREKYEPMGGPHGGDGGKGGSVILEASEDLNTLLEFRFNARYVAKDGVNGGPKGKHGRGSDDLILKVPCGTVVRDAETGEAVADLTHPGDTAMVAQGGRGGRGNMRFSSSRRQAPQFAEPGEPGIARRLTLELKLIADVGLLGFPNAGKSTLISVLSAAKPKIADYPFTTLTPNLGMVKGPTRPDGSENGVLFADIPGLIEGASEGHGLGHDFLRHVERTRLLLHLVDISGIEHDPMDAYQLINLELARHSRSLSEKPQVVILTKMDTVDEAVVADWQQQFAAKVPAGTQVLAISAVAKQGLEELRHAVFALLETMPPQETVVPLVEDTKATNHDDSEFEIEFEDNAYHITGGKVERLLRATDPRNLAAVHRLWNIYKAMGVHKALARAGAKEGDTVIICGDEFSFAPEVMG